MSYTRSPALTLPNQSPQQVLPPGLRSFLDPKAKAAQECATGRPSHGALLYVRLFTYFHTYDLHADERKWDAHRRCNTCGEYIYKGKKFNARKETVEGEDYFGIKIFRFYIKWYACARQSCQDIDRIEYANTSSVRFDHAAHYVPPRSHSRPTRRTRTTPPSTAPRATSSPGATKKQSKKKIDSRSSRRKKTTR